MSGSGLDKSVSFELAERGVMKKCPFCAEEIQDAAVKCRHCGEAVVSDEWRKYCSTYFQWSLKKRKTEFQKLPKEQQDHFSAVWSALGYDKSAPTPVQTPSSKKKTSPTTWGCLVLIILFGVVWVTMDDPSTSSLSSGSVNPVGEKRISGEKWIGCTDRDQHERLTQYAVQQDLEAFRKGLAAGMVTGTCVMFTSGEVVHIADTAVFSGLVKVRRSGDTTEYWTNLEAVQ